MTLLTENRLIRYRAEDFSKKKPIAATSNVDASKPTGTIRGQTVNIVPTSRGGYDDAYKAQQERDRIAKQTGQSTGEVARQQNQQPTPTTTAQNTPTSSVQPSSTSGPIIPASMSIEDRRAAIEARGAARQNASDRDPYAADQDTIANIQNAPTTKEEPVFNENGDMIGTRTVTDPNLVAQKNADLIAAKQALEQKRANDLAAQQKQQQDVTKRAAGQQMIDPQQSSMLAAFDSFVAQNPEIAPLAEAYKAYSQSLMGQEGLAGAAYGAGIANAENSRKQLNSMIDNFASSYKDLSGKMSTFLTAKEERDQKFLAEQEANAQERLSFEEQQITRKMAQDKIKAHDTMVAGLALSGGFASSNGLENIAQADSEADRAIADMRKEFGFARNDLTLQFAQNYQKLSDNLTLSMMQNTEQLMIKLEGLTQQSFAGNQAIDAEQQRLLENYTTTIATSRKEFANSVLGGVKELQASILQNKQDQQQKEKDAWNRLDWVKTTFGTNAPQSLIESIAKDIPNVNVQEIMDAPTLAELKERRLGGGGGSSSSGIKSFSIDERSSDGSAPTMESYLQDKEAQWRKLTKQYGPASPQQRADWERDYKAKLTADKVLSPTAIANDWKIKQAQAGNFTTLGAMKATQANIEDAIKRGDYQQARDIVDNIGRAPPEKAMAQVSSAQLVLTDLEKMANLIDRIEGEIGAFPTKGRLWAWMNENIETSPDYAELRQLVDSNLAPYSRGVSGERGATTEPDVQRAITSLLDPNTDAPALRRSLALATEKAQNSITLYLGNMREGGYRVKGVEERHTQLFDSDLSTPQQDFLNSF